MSPKQSFQEKEIYMHDTRDHDKTYRKAINKFKLSVYGFKCIWVLIITSLAKEVMFLVALVCLSVCLSVCLWTTLLKTL